MSDLRFFEKLDQIDRLISSVDESGYQHAFTEISAYLDNSHVCQYFFDQIDDENWTNVIISSEFIKKYRSGQIQMLENNQFDWFFMSYLLKVADKNPGQISSYMKSITSNDDEILHDRMIELMLVLPCDIVSELVLIETEWRKTKDSLYGLYPEFAGKLILHTQECNEQISFELVKEFLKVESITREVGNPGTESYYKSIDIKAKYSDWEYQSVLNKYISKFVLGSKNSIQYLEYFFEYMTYVLSLEKEDPNNDYSWIWRNTLEDNEQTSHISGIKEHMLVFLRDLSINLIKEDNSRFEEIISILGNYQWTIFKRLSIYLSVKFPEINIILTKRLIKNTDLYEDDRTRNEYSLLLDSAFGLVGQDVQSTVYNWIENEVDLDNYIRRYQQHEGLQPSQEEIEDYKSYWKKTRLHLIRNHLEGEKLAGYQSLVEEKGAPDHPEYSSYTTSWVGPTSPLTVEEINEQDIKLLIRELKKWEPRGKGMTSSPEGLSRNLSEAVKVNTDKFKHSVSLFKGISPTYIRGLFQGLRDNLTNLDSQSWSEIINLSEWVLSQDYDIEAEQDNDTDEDPGWSWCRKSIASLVDAGLKKGEGQIPIALREKVWCLILPLTQDPDPTPAYEEKYGGSNMGPTTLAINTVRGEAMHALVHYGLWVARNTTDKKINFEDIPEAKKVLDDHLDANYDPSQAIRSVYGQFFPWLNLLDTNWANEVKLKIFSDDELGLGNAAWDAYITFCQPYDDTYRVISDIYEKNAVKLSDIKESDDKDRSLEHFAGHMITFFWRSKLELGDEVLKLFYLSAPLKQRKYAIEFIGRSLRNNKEKLEENIEKRLKDFYEWRQAESKEFNEYGELEGFCWWINADIIDREWALNKFHELLMVQDKLDALDFAVKKLGNYLDINSLKVLECIDLMIDKLKTPGIYFTWDNAAQEILREALLNNDVRDQAIELVHKFGSKGFLKYRDLLSTE